MSEQNIVNVMVIPDVPKVLPGEQLYVYVPKASFTSPGIIAYNNTQFRIDGNFLFIREDYVSPGVQQKIDELKQYTDDKLQLKQDKEDNNISLAQRPEQKSVVGAINDLGTLTGQAQDTADDAIRKIGDLSTLTTDEKTTIVGAINEVDQHADANKTEIGDLSALTTDEKATLVGAINEVDAHTNTAQQAADAAQATADNATNLANTGISKADGAQTTANTAVDKANDAKATAQEAIMKADGRATSIGFMTAKDAVTALNGYPRNQLKGGDTIWIVEDGTPDLWVTEVAENSVPYNYTTKDKFNQDLVDNKVLQIGYFKTAYQESADKPLTIAWQNVLVKSTDWVASTEFADFPYEAKIELTDFVDYTTVPQVVFDIDDTMSGNYAPICKSGDKCVYIYGKVQDEITLKTVITFAPNVNGASVTGGGYNNRGKWVASTTYEIDDLVYTDNGQYVCIEGITSTTSPEQDTTHWQATFVATGKTKNTLTISGQDNGTGVQKTFDGSTAVEIAFDENTMTAKEVNGVLKVGAKGTIPEALPQEASALKSGKMTTSGWAATENKELYNGKLSFAGYNYAPSDNGKILSPYDYTSKNALRDWNGTIIDGRSIEHCKIRTDNAGVQFVSLYWESGIPSDISRQIRIYNDGTVKAWTYAGWSTTYDVKIVATFLSDYAYTISDADVTTNSDILMEITDANHIVPAPIESGKIKVISDTVPTSAIPYTYKVKQTNAAGQFTLVNHYLPTVPNTIVESVNGQTGAVTIAVPTKTSQLTNDSGFITDADIPTVPTRTSELTNDSGFLTTADIPTKTSQLENDSNFVTTSDIPTSLPQLAGTGVYDPFGTSVGENGDWKPNGTVIASSVTSGWGAGTHKLGTYSGDKTKLTEIVVKRDRLFNYLNVIVPRTSVADGVYTYTKTDEDNTTFTITIDANNEITYTVTGERAYTTYWLQENNTTWYSTRKTLVYDESREVWNADAIVEVNDGGGLKLFYKNELNLYFSRPSVPSSPIRCTYKVRQTSNQGQIVVINQYDGIGNIDGEWSEYIYPNVTLTEAGLYEIYAQNHDAFVYWDGKKLTKKLLRVRYDKTMDTEQTDVQRIYLDVDTIQITSEGVLSIEEANTKYSLEGALIQFGSSFSDFKYRKIK